MMIAVRTNSHTEGTGTGGMSHRFDHYVVSVSWSS